MVDIVTRAGKGSPLTNNEVDANFTNLAEVAGVTGEPMGHEDRTTSTISFNASTRTFTIAPVSTSFTVWCKGKKVVVSSAQTVTIPNTTGMYSIYYDANGVLAAKAGYFTFSVEAPTAYVYWNAEAGTCPYFGDERHGVVLDWQTHEYLHRTRGAALASGFGASGYTLGGNGSSNAHAQLTLEGGTFFDEDMKIIVTATNTPTAGTWEQDLLSPARIPVLYLSGTGWVIDAPTDYPLKQGTARPQYNALSGGVWSTADVANNKYATSWILATNNLTYPVIAIIGQAESDLQSAAEAVDFTSLQLPGFPSVEFRPLYRLVFQCADSFSNAVKASLVSITDIRSIAAAGVAASLITDHGNLSGLSDDDHPQYLSVDTVRSTLTAAVKASFLPSQTGNAGKFLTTDATSTSWTALTSGNITTALGFTPYNATNPAGYITGITSSDVTTALGFTPYNATNPSGYITTAGARGAISVTGAGSYDSATGVINIVGGVTSFNTRTGAITLSSADVTTALGFTPYNSTNPNGYLTGITSTQVTTALGYTPYNSTNPNGYISGITSGMVTTALGFTPYDNSNPSGYITSSALSGYLTSSTAASTYLPLAGGTLTGQITLPSGTPWQVLAPGSGTYNRHVQYITGTEYTLETALATDSSTASKLPITLTWRGGYSNTGGLQLTGGSSGTLGGNAILHSGNYGSYALPLSGGTLTGRTSISFSGMSSPSNTAILPTSLFNLSGGGGDWLTVGQYASSHFWVQASYSNPSLAYYAIALNPLGGSVTANGNQVLHAGNYSSYALPLSGGTMSGSITFGNDTANGLVNAAGTAGLRLDDAWGNLYIYNTQSGAGFYGDFGSYNFRNASSTVLATLNGSAFNSSVAIQQSGNQVLHAGNYQSYLGDYTFGNYRVIADYNGTNTWYIRSSGQFVWGRGHDWSQAFELYLGNGTTGNANGWAEFGQRQSNNTHGTWFGTRFVQYLSNGKVDGKVRASEYYLGDDSNYITGGGSGAIRSQTSYGYVDVGAQNPSYAHIQTDRPQFYLNKTVYVDGDIYKYTGSLPYLHSGNYSSYALPLSGGTVSGNLHATAEIRLNAANTARIGWRPAGSGTLGLGLPFALNPANGAINIETSDGDTGGLMIDNEGVTVYGAGDTGYVFRVIDEDQYQSNGNSVANATQFWVGQDSGTAGFRNQLTIAGNTALHAGNYNSYSPSLTGGNASGTWGINVTGNAGSATTEAKSSATTVPASTAFAKWLFATNSTGGTQDWNHISNTRPGVGEVLLLGNHTNGPGGSNYYHPFNIEYSGISGAGNVTQMAIAYGSPGNELYMRGSYSGSWNGWNRFLNSSNYNSYALPLSGGTLSGDLRVNTIRDTAGVWVLGKYGSEISLGSAGAVNDIRFNSSSNAAFEYRGNSILHAGNYLNYRNTHLVSPNGATVVSGDASTAMPDTGQSFIHTLATGPSGNDGHILGMSWANTTSVYGAQIWLDTDPTNRMAVRSRSSTGVWNGFWEVLTAGNYSSYALPLSGGTVSGSVTVNESYSNGWFRNNGSNQGLYNQSTGGHFCSLSSSAWQITGNGGGLELQFRANHNSTIRGYVYADTSNNFGLLHSGGGWSVQIYSGGNGYLHGTWNGANIRANRANGNMYIDDNYGNTVVGVYSSYRYQGVFAMGDSYKLPADGTTTGSLYGMAWSHPNAGGAAGNLSDHGLLIINNGVFKCAISNSIVASSNITAFSDERLKTNWQPMPEDYVTRLAQIKVGIYDRTDQENITQVGVSAQSLQKLLPHAIMTAKDEMQTLSVNYGGAALASAVELAKEVVDLRTRVAHLESLISKLIGD